MTGIRSTFYRSPSTLLLGILALWSSMASAQWVTRAGPWLSYQRSLAGVAAIESAATGTSVLFTAARDRGQKLHRSADQGATWQPVDIPGHADGTINWIGTRSTAGAQDLYVAIVVDFGGLGYASCDVLRSPDAGATWITVAERVVACIWAFDPSSTQRIYGVGAGYLSTFNAAAYRSDDGGKTWIWLGYQGTNLRTTFVSAIRISGDGNTVYVVSPGGVWISQDRGASWSPNGLPSVGANDLIVFRHPRYGDHFAIASTYDGFYQSLDDGKTWQAAGWQGFVFNNFGEPTITNGQWHVPVGYRRGLALLGEDGLVPYSAGLPQDSEFSATAVGKQYAVSGLGLSVCTSLPSCAGGVLPRMATLIEYHHSVLNHYFMTIEGAETASIEAGAAGPGWARTGQTFRVYADTRANAASSVCRFYGSPGRGPNSHFFTSDSAECSAVKSDAGWTLESPAAFAVFSPATRLKPGGPDNAIERYCVRGQAVYRVYNNRFAQNDSNHRYVSDPALYDAMKAKGWSGEGVMMCAIG